MLARLNSAPPAARAGASAAILALLTSSPAWRAAELVLLYSPLRSEPDLSPLFHSGAPALALPRVTKTGLELYAYSDQPSLQRSRYGILEPAPDRSAGVALEQIDLVVVPGLAFDPESGIRLGRGGGYYDRLFAEEAFSALSIGVGFEFQMLDGLPAEPHDQAVGYVLSEAGLRPTQAASAQTPESA